jgi:CRISPR-associated protein Cmr4
LATATFQQTAVLGLYTETPLHCGAEGGTGYVDLPVQRERHTRYPVIPGSSIKGTLRDELAGPLGPEKVNALFGETTREPAKAEPDATDGGNGEAGKQRTRPGTASFGDGILVAFPVRSSGAPFHWVTCPFALERAFRAMGERVTLEPPQRNEAWGAADDAILLEEIAVAARKNEAFFSSDSNSGLALLKRLLPADDRGFAYTRGLFEKRLLILADEDFGELVETGTEILTRIKLNALGTTANLDPKEHPKLSEFECQGNLFVEEVVPSETLFFSALRSTGEGAAELQGAFGKRPVLRLGGDETIGRGLTHVTYLAGGGR